jgi:SAM-dependent methyltransferase
LENVSFEKNQEYYKSVRTDLLSLAPELRGRVLEIGCAEGLTLEYLQATFDCQVVGLDYCESALAKARSKGFEVCVCDLNSEPLPFKEGEFDYILIGDVLEHLYDPWSVLAGLVKTMKDDGTILISIPNVKHYSLLKDLILRDRWEYRESGLLDSTHIRFFTYDGIRKLLARSGLTLVRERHNIVRSRVMWLVNKLCFNSLHTFFVFHYLVAAKKTVRG